MTGKHVAPPLHHTRRGVLLAAVPLGLAVAAVATTGELPKVSTPNQGVAPPLPLAEERVTTGAAREQAVRVEEARSVADQQEAAASEAQAKAAARKARAKKASRSRRAASSASKAAALIATSREYFGIPYRWGGKTAKGGLDCSGYTKLVYARHGVDLPHGSRAQAKRGVQVKHPKPGDLLFVKNALGIVHHVAIYVGNGYMHDAPRTGLKVGRRRIWSKPSRTFYRRVL